MISQGQFSAYPWRYGKRGSLTNFITRSTKLKIMGNTRARADDFFFASAFCSVLICLTIEPLDNKNLSCSITQGISFTSWIFHFIKPKDAFEFDNRYRAYVGDGNDLEPGHGTR